MDTTPDTPDGPKQLSEELHRARRSKRPAMTQAEAGAILGVSQSTYSRLETGENRRWSPDQRAGAAQIMGVLVEAVDIILAGDDSASRLRELADKQAARFDQVDAHLADLAANLARILAALQAVVEVPD